MARLIAYRDALGEVEPRWTVAGVLEGLGLLWGEAGVGKSFVAVSLAAAIASGRPWLGHRVVEGPVVDVAGEGGAQGVARRIDAAVLGHVAPRLLVVDTLARCFGGGDENSSQDMSRFVGTLDLLRELFGGSVLVVHHANKTDKVGAGKVRGSSVLYGAVDVSMQLVPGGGTCRLVMDKLRDRDVTAPAAELRFDVVPVWGERDELGDVRTTRVVRPSQEFEAALPGVACVPIKQQIVTYEAWRAACPQHAKGLFDRLAVAVLGDPQTWGVRELTAGVFGTRART